MYFIAQIFHFLCKRPSFRYKEFECGNNSWEAKLADDMLVLFASTAGELHLQLNVLNQ